ncbi:SDR family oxidoreductase [Pseudoalteromonas denitrificans]|uniref:3-oxoacyl-[acyl-carrier protein] reductase n=1 Tax=Pseudoalteromonas denitrificans DSM 6059 TaxID=1123010 RepID=A0A1I1M061_9GAMM|nr:SDR family oxidoreductase [Pseudoalteromonas denitrificans]SFC78486.1 3-oxoacyl-[acyl-carrier protein] reductase [Pseudoalteromonas denitrificans DSM 6059]
MNIKNKTIVITGGAQGLGFAMAQSFFKQGANIALIDMTQTQLSDAISLLTKGDITKEGSSSDTSKVLAYVANVTNEDEVIKVFKQVNHDFGSIDVLINNAGITRDGMFIKVKEGEIVDRMSLSQFQSVIDVNLTGVFLCGREAATYMIEAQKNDPCSGVIINMSSISRAGNMGQTNYAASKAGVVALTTTWAKELGQFNIRVAAIAPGVIDTQMTRAMKPQAQARMIQGTSVGRFGTAEEIAHSAQYIIENDFFTGRVIEIDGGIRI